MDRSEMVSRWVALFPTVSVDVSVHWFRWMAEHYDGPDRHFHDLDHPAGLNEKCDRYFPDAPASVRKALWLHDLICVMGGRYNESDSAMLARVALHSLGTPEDEITVVAGLILVTRGHFSVTPLEQIVCDLDLHTLGDDPSAFERGRAKIRLEAGAYSDEQFAVGRKRFVGSMLERPYIYATSVIRKEREGQAHANLEAEWTTLEAA